MTTLVTYESYLFAIGVADGVSHRISIRDSRVDPARIPANGAIRQSIPI